MSPFDHLIHITKRLREPDGCPWDKEQTFQTLTPHIIEEAYELVDAIEKEDMDALKEELGDVLLHVVMLSNMAEEDNHFTVHDVARDEADKMVRRHPHVFGEGKADTVDDVWKNWDAIKQQEKKQGTFDSIPKHFPALLQAHKIQKKASRLGFDWPDEQGPLDKVAEEAQELAQAVHSNDSDMAHCEEELGDLLFSLVNVSRKLGLNPEEALRKANQKFIHRFEHMERALEQDGKPINDTPLDQLEVYWRSAKST